MWSTHLAVIPKVLDSGHEIKTFVYTSGKNAMCKSLNP